MRFALLAIIIILIIAAPIWAIFGSRLFEKDSNQKNDNKIEELVIQFPEDETVTDSTSIPLKGSAPGGQFIAVTGPTVSQILTLDENNNFSIDLNLEKGFNEFKIYSFNSLGVNQELTRLVYQLKEEGNEESSIVKIANAQGDESSDSANLEKLKKVLKNSRAKRNLRVVSGKVKTTLSDTINITKINDTKTILVNEQTDIQNYYTGTKLAFDKILVNDTVVSLGEINSSGTYTSELLLVSPDSEIIFPNKFVFSTIGELDDDVIAVTDENNVSYQIDVSNAKQINNEAPVAGDQIGAVGSLKDNNITSSYFIIFKQQKPMTDSTESAQTATKSAQ